MLGFLNAAMSTTTQRFINYAEGEGKLQKQKSIFTVSISIHFLLSLLMVVIFEIAYFFFFNGILNIYNPQNEMFRLLGTKRSFSQNETFFFSHP